jgi:hypothetical protein
MIGQHSQMKSVLLSFVSLLLITCNSQITPCIIWRNSFLEITQTTPNINETVLSCRVRSRQTTGWIGVGFSKSDKSFENSIFILSYLPGTVLVLKNHTELDKSEKLNEFTTKQSLGDIIDGIYEFSFNINSTLVLEKNFIFFANNEDSLPPFSNNSEFPKHKAFSKPIYLNLLNKNIEFPACEKNLNSPGRAISRHWIGYLMDSIFSIIVMLLFVYFRNDQPLKSRFAAPLIGIVCLTLNCFSYFWSGSLTYEEHSVQICKITGFLSYPLVQMTIMLPTLMMIRYSVLLQLHLHKSDFIKNWKNLKRKTSSTSFSQMPSTSPRSKSLTVKFNSKLRETQAKPTVVKLIKILRQMLLVLQSPWALLIAPVLWFAVFEFGIFIIFASGNFTCKPLTKTLMRQWHTVGLAFVAISFSFFFVLDFVLSIKNFIRCRWRKYIFEEDPFHFRVDFLTLIVFVPLLLVWAILPMPILISGIISDIMFYSGTALNGGLALVITMIKKLIFIIKSNKIDNKRLNMTIDFIIKDEILLEKFVEFSELEWSSENVYFKIDSAEYQKKTDIKSRRNAAIQIKENYLTRNISPLEINVSGKALNPTLKQIEELDFCNDLFEKINREVDVNLCDTLARFIVSSQYDHYLTEKEKVLSKMGL